MAKKRDGVTSASEILIRKHYKGKSKERIMRAKETMADLALGDKIRAVRENAGLTQAQLAERIGTQPTQISRIEDADYDGHCVETLRRIAQALHLKLRIDFVAEDRDADKGSELQLA